MRKLFHVALPFSVAVFLAVYLLPDTYLLPLAIGCGLVGLALIPWRHERWTLRAILVLFGLCIGFGWTTTYRTQVYAPTQGLVGMEVAFTATVTDYPSAGDYALWVPATLHFENRDVKTYLTADLKYTDLAPGDSISGVGTLRTSAELSGIETDYYTAQGIYLFGTVQGDLTVTTPDKLSFVHFPAILSKKICDTILALFPSDTASVAIALITGDKTYMSDGLYAAFQRSGIAHVVAVSGLHISFLAGLITTLLRGNRKRGAVITIALLFFFAAVTGNSPSVLRAVFLQCFLLIAPLVGRENDKATSLSVALMVLLVYHPLSAASVSLQLSFAAVSGIYLFTGSICDMVDKRLPSHPKGWREVWGKRVITFITGTLATTFGALVFTTPLLAYYYESVSLIAPLTNLLTLWAVSDAFMGGIFVALIGLIAPVVATPLAWVISLLLRYVVAVAYAMSALPFAAVSTYSVYIKLWLCLTYFLLFFWIVFRRRQALTRPILPLSLSLSALILALLANSSTLSAGQLTISALDVGQGQSVLFVSDGATALVDCGGSSATDSGTLAADSIQALGDSTLDLLILTHCHDDHAGGVPTLFERVEIGTLILPMTDLEEPLREEILTLAWEHGTQVILLEEELSLTFGHATMTLYPPLGSGDANEEGLTALCTVGDFDTLITGDMEDVIEQRLIKYYPLPDIELLMVGHHGSKYSTCTELLEATTPEYAIISVGNNSYGHPTDEVLIRLTDANCAIYRTDLMGTVTFTVN